MSKNKIDIAKEVMSKIESGQVKMRPKWMFVAATISLVFGIVGVYILSAFLVSIVSFSLRTHGPMGEVRYQELLDSFPLWAVCLAIIGLIIGVFLLKKFDFSYKKNFVLIILIFVIAVLISGWLADYLGLARVWSKQGQLRRLYHQDNGNIKVLPWKSDGKYNFGQGNGQGHGGVYNGY